MSCLKVTPEINISKGKPTVQSSTHLSVFGSHLCVDGKTDKFCHTSNYHPYWIVDLQGEFSIQSVTLFNRLDCCSERIIGTVIELLTKYNELLHSCGSITENKILYKFSCNNKFAYKVRVRQTRNDYLHFTELEVYGAATGTIYIPPSIVSKGKPTSQTSTVSSRHSSSVCVDGNTNEFCCTLPDKPSWTVDLQGAYIIDSITLYNRIDCCSERIVGATIELLTENNELFHVCGMITEKDRVYNFSCNYEVAYKVRVRHSKDEYLHFTELAVLGDPIISTVSIPAIVSRGKPTSLSSTFSLKHGSSVCVDGNENNYCCSLPNKPHFTVNLEGIFSIYLIVLHNRNDCCSEKIVGALIELLSKEDEIIKTCGVVTITQPLYTFTCDNAKGFKVRVRLTKNEYLHFTELDVIGVPVKSN